VSVAIVAMLAVLGAASRAPALVISGGPTYSLPGGGSCTISGITSTGTGATVSCTGISLASHTNVYLGIRNDINVNGNTMTGAGPTSGSADVFRSSSTAASSITYTSTTTVASLIPAFGTDAVTNTLTLTRTAGTASVVATGGTPANSAANGDIGHLFKITSGSILTLDVDVLAASPHFSGQACPAVYDPSHAGAGAGGERSRVDVAFYFSDCGDGVIDSPEVCDDGLDNGTLDSCCSSSCTFRSNGAACTDDGVQCTFDTCNGVSSVCQHPNKPGGTACTGNGVGDCTNADTCNGSGVCLNNDVGAGTSCPDTSPPSSGNCKDAQCNGFGVCDQNFANEVNGTGCDDSVFCNGTDTCTGGTCSTHTGDPCPGADGDSNCAESCNEGGDNCLANDPDGSACSGNGTGECTSADTCLTGACNNNDVAAGTSCFDTAPPSTGDCLDAQCNGSGTCDQGFANETNGTGCDNGLFCDGTETCTTGTCTNSSGDPCPGPDNDVDCSESCDESSDTCTANDADGTTCRPDAGECDVQETCLAGLCPADAFEPAVITPCGSNADTDCTNPDFCDGLGTCLANDEINGFPCGDPTLDTCTSPDTCDGSGTCLDNHQPTSTVCRPLAIGSSCDVVENCDGAGNCPADGFEPSTTTCRASGGDCDVAEACTGSSAFCPADGFASNGTPCGDPTDTDCDNADTCDGNNTCLDNLVASGTGCGDPTDTDCDNADTCDGSGTCLDNLESSGTACGDASDTTCTDADTCDGSGTCLANNASNGTSCDDGSDCTISDACASGICSGVSINCPLDHYKCYQGKDLKNPKFIQQIGVETDDQFINNQVVDAKKLKFVCTPVDKNGEGINDPNAHLACYQLKAPTFGVRPQVQLSTQFQSSLFEVKKGKLICLPASKTIIP
jgi:hypothetical protein